MARYGGLPGLRDLDLLKSAVAMPQATFDREFLHADIFEMAAAYLFHIVGNHPFLDGNKRAGAVESEIERYLKTGDHDQNYRAWPKGLPLFASLYLGEATAETEFTFRPFYGRKAHSDINV
jgi:hypothetical protein